jgi:hypothetical protein
VSALEEERTMSDLLDEDRAKLARALGMKPREIVAAAEVQDADPPAAVVETHDGQRVLVISDRDGGAPFVAPWDGPMLTGEVLDVTYTDEPVEDADDDPDADPDTDEVPPGTAAVVLGWVGDNADRARRALVAEQDSAKPRKTLIEDLKKLAGQA